MVPLCYNLSNPLLPKPQSSELFVSKINGTSGDDQWVQQGITTGIGQWTKDVTVDASSTIYLTGYLNGSIDFLQGDAWNSTLQCDNTYVLKVFNGNNTGVIERYSNLSQGISFNEGKENNRRVYLLKNFNELLNLNHSIINDDFGVYDLSGKEVFRNSGGALQSDSFIELDNGMYILRGLFSNETLLFVLSE